MSNKCCRCEMEIKEGSELGGTFDGVVCTKHRSCQTCWFARKYSYGIRAREPSGSRDVPLVYDPRKGQKPRCFGCLKEMPPHKAYHKRERERNKKMEMELEGVDMSRSGKSYDDAIVL